MYQAIFIDRDGTINRDVPYCRRPEDFELLPGVGKGISLLNQHNFKVVVVTNQSGIARGYFTEEMLVRIHEKMSQELAKYGAFVDAIYHCPHHPDDNCNCRKPAPGLFAKAAEELHIDLGRSYVLGDKLLDIYAAKKVGCKAVLVPSSEPELDLLKSPASNAEIDFICPDFYTGVTWIITEEG